MKTWEKIWPWLCALICAVAFYFFQSKFKDVQQLIGKLIDYSLVVSGTMLGFLLTITTIINAIHTRRMSFIRESGNFGTLHRFLTIAIILNIVTISLVIIMPFVYGCNLRVEAMPFIYSAQLFIILWNWFANIRFTTVFIRLLTDGN